MSKQLILYITLLFMNLMAFSAGSLKPLQGNRGSGMAHTFTGFDKNAETLWFNPGAAHQPKGSFMVSTGISVSQEFTTFQMMTPSVYQASTINPLRLPWYLYFSAAIHERFTLGLAVNSLWSSSIKWQEENWAGRYIVKHSQLKTSFVQPSITYQINDQWQFGVGIVIAGSALDFSRSLALRDQSREGHMEITGKTIQWGINSGIYYQPTEQMNLGLSYKSAMKLNFNNATALFHTPTSLQSFFPEENSVSAYFYLPAIIDLHASTRISPSWTIAIAAGMQWHQNNENTTFDFSQNNAYLQDFQIYRDDKIQLVSRIGGEYYAAEFLHFRVGMYYQDGASGPDFFSPEKPDADKIGITAGITLLPLDGLSLDLSITYVNSKATGAQYIPANFGGTYKSAVYMSGIGITYRF